MRRRSLLAAAILLAGACAAPAGAPPPAPRPGAPLAVLELEPYLGILLTTAVTVADTTLPFLFDTGGGGTFFTPAAAGLAGCEPFGRVTGFRHDGELVHARRCPSATVELGAWRSPSHETGVFDLMSLLPDGVPPLGGLVALNTFEGAAITLELWEERVTVESRGSLEGRVADMQEVPFREGRQSGGAMLDPFLAIRAPQGALWFELDSGNAGPVLIAPHAAEQIGVELSREQPRAVTLHLEGFGPVEVEALEKEMIYDGLLNAAFLRRHRVTLDLDRKRAWVAPAAPGTR